MAYEWDNKPTAQMLGEDGNRFMTAITFYSKK